MFIPNFEEYKKTVFLSAEKIFLNNDYKKIELFGDTHYEKNGSYCRFTYNGNTLGFLFETSDCLDEMKKDLYEDSGHVLPKLPLEEFLEELKDYIIKYIL